MGMNVVQDESGRVHVHVDDSSQLVSISPLSQTVGNSGDLVEVLRVPLQVPAAAGRPGIFLPVTRGQILLGSSINAPAGFTQNLTMEVALVGYLGAQGIVIDRGVLSAGYPTRRARVESEEPYTALGLLARQLVDGAPDSTVNPPSFQVQISGLFWS